MSEKEKEYKPFSRTIKIEEKTGDYEVREERLQKYAHLMSTKVVHALREDQEMANKYVHYARTKSALKREINRRNESRRLMSAKSTTNSAIKFSKVVLPQEKENWQSSGGRIVELEKDPLALKVDQISAYPTYDKKQMLNELYQEPI